MNLVKLSAGVAILFVFAWKALIKNINHELQRNEQAWIEVSQNSPI